MKKKESKRIFLEYRCLKRHLPETLAQQGIGSLPEGLRKILQNSGFETTHSPQPDDGQAEISAAAENVNQEFLVDYFNGHVQLSGHVIEAFMAEKNADSPNYPLLQRYFKTGNPQLKLLLLAGLDRHPLDRGLLHDLAYFHEFNPMFDTMMNRYQRACDLAEDLELFQGLAEDYYFNTFADGLDAYRDLTQRFSFGSPKRVIVERLITESDTAEADDTTAWH